MITILDGLEESARRFPSSIICEDTDTAVTYQAFVDHARAIGTGLCRHVAAGRPVAVLMDNTPASWEAMIGAVYGGGFYAAIDAQTPIERIRTIFRTLSPAAVIVDQTSKAQIEQIENVNLLLYDDLVKTPIDEEQLRPVRKRMIDTDPAYALFTSGSTGTPKGVLVNHDCAIKYARWLIDAFHIDETTIWGSQSPFYFSMSVSTMFSTLLSGAKLVVIPKQLFSFPLKLIEFMNEKRVNTIYWVYSAMNMVANRKALDHAELPYLKTVLFAGGVVPNKQLNYWRRHMPEETLFGNLYGPTEAADTVAYYIVDRQFRDDEPLPIGHACANCSVVVLKDDNTPAGIGEEGELCVRGSFLACGYYNEPERTAESFVQNPLNTSYPERMYRTGDILRYNELGELVYVRRKDSQIKHQGYRVELGEVEAAVNLIENVHECACIFDGERDLLILYGTGENLSAKDILSGVKDRLPKYMMPNKFIFLEEMPHNANGKIDKKLLKQLYAGNT